MGTDKLPLPKKRGQSPQFSAHVCCVQAAGWITIPLGTKVYTTSAQATLCYIGIQLTQKGYSPAIFGPCLLWALAKRSPIAGTAEHLLIFFKNLGFYTNSTALLIEYLKVRLHHPDTRQGTDVQAETQRRNRMWANAQRDGRPAEHRWRPLFNAAKFG